MHRRQVIASVVSLLSAGCISARDSDTPINDTSSPTEVPRETDGTGTPECMEGHGIDVEDFDPIEQLPTDIEEPAEEVVTDAVENGETEIETYGEAPIDNGGYIESDSSFYRIKRTERDPENVTAYEFDISWEKGQEAPEGETVIAFEELPVVDQRALELAIDGPQYERERHPEGGIEIGSYPAPYPDGRFESELPKDETTWVEYEDRVYEVVIGDQTSKERRTYVYEADRVASDAESFEEYVIEEYVIDLDDLSDAGQSVLEEAIDEGYKECEPRSEGLKALDERLTDETELPGPDRGNWYASFESECYLLERSGWVV